MGIKNGTQGVAISGVGCESDRADCGFGPLRDSRGNARFARNSEARNRPGTAACFEFPLLRRQATPPVW